MLFGRPAGRQARALRKVKPTARPAGKPRPPLVYFVPDHLIRRAWAAEQTKLCLIYLAERKEHWAAAQRAAAVEQQPPSPTAAVAVAVAVAVAAPASAAVSAAASDPPPEPSPSAAPAATADAGSQTPATATATPTTATGATPATGATAAATTADAGSQTTPATPAPATATTANAATSTDPTAASAGQDASTQTKAHPHTDAMYRWIGQSERLQADNARLVDTARSQQAELHRLGEENNRLRWRLMEYEQRAAPPNPPPGNGNGNGNPRAHWGRRSNAWSRTFD